MVGYLCTSILLFTVAVPGDRHMRQWNPIGQILFAFGAWSLHARMGVARGLRLRRCEAARDALRDVDAAGDFYSGRHRHHPLFYLAQSHAEGLPGLRAGCSVRICFLPALRHVAASYLPELRAWRRARLVELPALRHEIAVTGASSK